MCLVYFILSGHVPCHIRNINIQDHRAVIYVEFVNTFSSSELAGVSVFLIGPLTSTALQGIGGTEFVTL